LIGFFGLGFFGGSDFAGCFSAVLGTRGLGDAGFVVVLIFGFGISVVAVISCSRMSASV
jgi:hypothetical protein